MSERVLFRSVLRVPEFRALWVAEAQSLLGDQLARVALVVLAYRQTGSTAVTGLIYALTFLPAIVGGATLSSLADRLPRRAVMICCDVVRAFLVAAMAVPHLPLAVLGCLLVVAVIVGRLFAASQLAVLPEVLHGEAYVVGSGLRMVTDQIGQLLGFAGGGFVVAALGPRPALLVNAGTFLVSAAIVRAFVHARPAAQSSERHRPTVKPTGSAFRSALTIVFGNAQRRTLLALGCLAAFYVVPEGLAPAYAASLGGGTGSVGALMAALPLGTALGAAIVVRVPAERRGTLLGPFSIAAAAPLMACALGPGIAISLILWATAGVFSAYQVEASAAFVASLPNAQRGAAIGLASSAVLAAQGLGLVGFGAVADYLETPTVIAIAALAGLLAALPLAVSWARLGHGRATIPAPPLAM